MKNKTFILVLFIFILFSLCLTLVSADIQTSFASPTPTNGTLTTNTSIIINVSISGSNLSSLIYNWNGTNYTFYDSSLLLMMNFDNLSVLGESSAKVIDMSKYGNNGTVNGAASWNSSGKYGGGYNIPSAGSSITLTGISTPSQYTISVWKLFPLPTTTDGWRTIVAKNTGNYHHILFNVSGYIGIYNGQFYSAGYNANSLSGWHQITTTASGSTSLFYIDGVYVGTANSKIVGSDISGIGNYVSGGGQWCGPIDELRVWNRTLSSSEIQQLYMLNLQKYNQTQWYFYVNQSKNATTRLDYGTYNYQTFANDTSNNLNSTDLRTIILQSDITYPIFSNNITNVANGSQYNSANNYQFNITITSTNGTAGIEFNGVNYSLSNISNSFYWNAGNLGVGSYNYYFWSYGNGTSHLFNTTQTYSYAVVQNSSYVLNLTGTTPIIYGAATDFAAHESGCPSQLSCSLNISDAIYSAGTISANYSTSGNANYSAGSVIATITINKATSQTGLTFDKTSPQSYGIAITPTCSLITGVGSVSLTNGTSGVAETLGAGTWNINCSYAGNENYSASSNSTNFIINQAIPSLTLSPTSPITYGTSTDFSSHESGCPSQLTCSLNISDGIYSAGTVSANYSTLGNQNYTANSVVASVTINKANPSANMQITGTTPIIYPTTSDFSGSETNTGDSDCSYSLDKTNGVYGVGTRIFNYSTAGCINYTAGSVTKNLIVNQNTTYILGISKTSPITYGTITDFTGIGCPSELSCSLNITNGIYGAGVVYVNYSTNGNENYSANSVTGSITINKAGSSVSLSATTSITYGTITDFTGSNCPSGATCNLNITNGIYSAGIIYANYSFAVNQNYTGSSSVFSVTINKAVPNIVSTVTSPINYGTISDFTCTGTNSGGSDLTYNLNQSNQIYGAGTVYVNCSTSGGQNYTSNSTVKSLIINEATSQTSLTFDKISPQSYTNSITPTCSVIAGQGTPILSLNGTIINSGSSITLGVGTWQFNCSLADNGNYSLAENVTNFQITQNSSYILNMNINPSWNVNYGIQTNVSGSACPTQLTCNLYNNVSGIVNNGINLNLGAGAYNFTYNTTGNANYSSIGVSNILIVSQANGYTNLSLNGAESNLTLTYPQQVNITAVSSYGTLTIYKDGKDITDSKGINEIYGFGYYNITAYSSGNVNYTNSYKLFWLNVTKAMPVLTFLANGGVSNLTLTYPQQVNISAISDSGTIGLDKDNVDYLTNNGLNISLGVGSYIFRANTTGNENYSNFGYSYYNITLNRANSIVNVYLNYSRDNITITQGNSIWLNASKSGQGLVYLYLDGNLLGSGENVINYTLFSTLGIFNITAIYPQTQNYTQGSETFWVNVTQAPDYSYPLFSNYHDNNGTLTNYGEGIFNVTIINTNGTVLLEINNQSYMATNLTANTYNVSVPLSNGTYSYYWESWGNGADNLYNFSTTNSYNMKFFDIILPLVSIEKDAAQIEYGLGNISINWNASDNLEISYSVFNITKPDGSLLFSSNSNSGSINLNISDLTHVGIYNINLWANDTFNNIDSTSTTFSVNDTISPLVYLISPLEITYANPNVVFNISTSESSSCLLSLDEGINNFSMNADILNTKFYYVYNNLSDGNYFVRFYCNDLNGHLNNSVHANFSVDTLNPVVNILYPLDGYYLNYNQSVSLNYSILTNNTDSCWYSLDLNSNETIPNCENLTLNLSEGNHLINLWINKTSGLERKDSVNFTIDMTSPSVSSISPLNETVNETTNNIDFYYNVSDNNKIINCSLFVNGELKKTVDNPIKDQQSNISIYLPSSYYYWVINCIDIANNMNSSEIRIINLSFIKVSADTFDGNTTNFYEMNSTDLSHVENLTLEKSNIGKVVFTDKINLLENLENYSIDLDKNIMISSNRIEINTSNLPVLEKPAILQLYGLDFKNPRILRNGAVCASCTIINYSGGLLIFNVSSFSVYSAEETPTLGYSSSSGSSSIGGGGSGIIKKECEIDTQCKTGYSCYNSQCVKLFDVEILKIDPLTENINFPLTYLIKGMADIKGDVIIKFWLEKENKEIMLGQDSIYLGSFEEKIKSTNLNLPSNIPNGDYELHVQVNFENYQAESFRDLNVNLPEGITLKPNTGETSSTKSLLNTNGTLKSFSKNVLGFIQNNIFSVIIIFLIIILSLLFFIVFAVISKDKESNIDVNDRLNDLNRLKKQNEINSEEYKLNSNLYNEIKSANLRSVLRIKIVWIIILLIITVVGISFLFLIGNMTGSVIGSASKQINWISFFMLLLGIIGLLIINYKKIILKNKKPANYVSNVAGKFVYTRDGYKIGKVKETYLADKKIYGLLITLDKKFGKVKGKKIILLPYSHIKSIGKVVIVEEKVILAD